jgi:lipopolysaccharide exporter
MDQEKIIAGGRWVVLTTLATSGLGLVTTLLLPKFIAPEEYGLFALGTMVMAVFQRLGQFGQSEFIIYKGRGSSGVQRTAFTTFILSNLLFLGLQLVCADVLASFFHNPRLAGLYRWMSLGYGLSAFTLVPTALLVRDLEFKKNSGRSSRGGWHIPW